MKGISNNRTQEGSAQHRSGVKLLRWKAALLALAAVGLLAGLSGCASARGGGDFDPSAYNPNTGYPAVGGGVPWHM